MDLVNVFDFEAAARGRLSEMAYSYYASGAWDELTLRENHQAYERITLRYRVLVDVSNRDLSTIVLGEQISMPIMIAPVALQKMAHPDGELATVRAAGAARTIMILSTISTSSIEEVMKVATGAVWFQLYVYKDRGVTRSLVERAEAAGCRAIVLTVDTPLLGCREADVRNRFQLPEGMSLRNLVEAHLDKFPKDVDESGLFAYMRSLHDPSLTWKDVEWLCSITRLPVLVKGVVRPDDAVRAAEHGVAGIIVSNHGGRQLDTAPATITVLPEIVEAVAGRVDVFVDGGVRRGTDVIKAISLGAKAVLVGRPVVWGLAVDGENGVRRILELLRNELDLAMALSGCPSIRTISRDLVS